MDQSIFRAYDIRGIYPEQLNAEVAYKIGQAYAATFKPTKAVAVGRDVRLHSEELREALMQGLTDAGVDVWDIGLISTELLYFAVGYYKLGGGIVSTASHNPKEWHGFKLVKENVVPITGDTGIPELKNNVLSGEKVLSEKKGEITKRNVLDDFCIYALTWINKTNLKPIKLVYDPNFGFEGKVLERLVQIGNLPATLIPLNAEPNGNFPKGRPDPMVPEERPEFIALVKDSGADLGVAWDADADRVFFCADGGTFVDPYYSNALLAQSMLEKHPGECVVYEPRYAWAILDVVKSLNGKAEATRIGHSLIKAKMREVNAVFAGESSGHTYFRDFWFSDSGLIPLLLVWELISRQNAKLSDLVRPLVGKYPISGETNFTTDKKAEIIDLIAQTYKDGQISHLDGVTVEYPEWRANIRPSNSEPLLRLNVEAKTPDLVLKKRDELVKLIKENA